MSSQLTAWAFRRRVLRPAEGVFLFHPRVLQRLEVATAALDVRVALYPLGRKDTASEPVVLKLEFDLRTDELRGEIALEEALECLGAEGEAWLKAEAACFLERAACLDYGM